MFRAGWIRGGQASPCHSNTLNRHEGRRYCTYSLTDLRADHDLMNEYTNVEIAKGGPVIKDGFMYASDLPGLGVEPNYEVLGDPIGEVS